MQVPQSEIVNPASPQNAERNRFRIRRCIAVAYLSVQHDNVEAGRIKIGAVKGPGPGSLPAMQIRRPPAMSGDSSQLAQD